MQKNNQQKTLLKNIGFISLLLIAAFLLYVVIKRALTWTILWDEGVTYCTYVHPMFGDVGLIRGLKNYWWHMTDPRGCNMCLGNNHILNSVLIGVITSLSGICYEEYILRIPVMLGFVLYLVCSLIMYKKEYIEYTTVIFLWCAGFAIEYFSIARGYSLAAGFIILAILFLELAKRKEDKKQFAYIILCIAALTVAEVAQTISLLIVICFYLYILIYMVRSKKVLAFLKRTWFPLLLLIGMNLVMVLYHFKAMAHDNLATDANGNIFSVITGYVKLLWTREQLFILPLILLGLLLVFAIIRLIQKKDKLDEYRYTCIFFTYVAIMGIACAVAGMGVALHREAIPAYPVFALAVGELIRGVGKFLREKEVDKKFPVALLVSLIVLVVCSLNFATNLKQPYATDTDEVYITIKDNAYKVYESGVPVDYSYFYETPNIHGIWFYRNKIKHETGFDILTDATNIWE